MNAATEKLSLRTSNFHTPLGNWPYRKRIGILDPLNHCKPTEMPMPPPLGITSRRYQFSLPTMFVRQALRAGSVIRTPCTRHGSTATYNFRNKCVIVTGGANGIGRAIAASFTQDGASVLIADTDLVGGELAAADLTRAGPGRATFCLTNMASESSVQAMVAAAVAEHGSVDILVNNAALFVFGHVTDVTEETWDRVLGTNVKGYAFACKHCIPEMAKRSGGAIVNLSSISAFIAQEGFVPYSLTKAAVLVR